MIYGLPVLKSFRTVKRYIKNAGFSVAPQAVNFKAKDQDSVVSLSTPGDSYANQLENNEKSVKLSVFLR